MFLFNRQKLYKSSEEFETFIPLEKQPYYAVASLALAFVFLFPLMLSHSSTISGSNKETIESSFIYKLIKHLLLSAIGSLFLGIAIVFLTNSFGVYV